MTTVRSASRRVDVAVVEPRERHHAPADLEAALNELGIEIWRTNDDEVTCWCPAHLERTGREERHPSWAVNRNTGLHNCFSCGFRGTFLDLVMWRLFPHDVFRAARWIRQFGLKLADRADDVVTSVDDWKALVTDDGQIELMPETKLAMYDDVPDWALEKRQLSRESVDHYGIRWNGKRDSWIIPVRTPTRELLGWQEKWQGRRRFNNHPKEMKKSLVLFGLDVFPVGEPAVLLESPLDVCRLFTAGYVGGLSSYGAAVSTTQMKIIQEVTDELVVALDNDRDGRLHAEELRSGKYERGKMVQKPWAGGRLDVRFFDYGASKSKDIGDMADAEIQRGLYEAQHWTTARLGTPQQEQQRRVHRRTTAVPSTPRRANGRPGAVPADRRRGNGKDPDDHRRRRGAA